MGCQVGGRQHCYAHCSSHLLRPDLYSYVSSVSFLSSLIMRVGGGGRGDAYLSRIMLLVGVGLNSSGDPDKTSCCELVLREEVRLLVGLSGGEVAGSRGVRGMDKA